MSQWSNDAYQSFSLLLGSKPPTGCPTPFGWKHSDDWCDSQILSHTVIHFLPLRSLEVSQNKVPHKTNTWSIKGTFWQLPLKAIPSQSVPLTAANLSRSSIPKQAINHPKQPLIHLLDCFLSNWLSVCLFGFVSSVLWQNGRCCYREAEVYKSRHDNRLLQVPIHSQVKLWWRHGHIICSCVATEEHVLLFCA